MATNEIQNGCESSIEAVLPSNHKRRCVYDLSKDWTQSDDVAAANPEKLKDLKELFLQEARKYDVLPLDATVATRLVAPRPNITAGRSVFTYTKPLTGIPQGDSPIPLIMQWDETFDIGSDTGTPVDDQDYQVPFKFTGKLSKLTLRLDRPQLTPVDQKRLLEAERNNKMSE